MLFRSKQFDLNIALMFLLGIYNKVDITIAHRCYVCGPDAGISCDKFDPTNKSFIKDCPSAEACSIQTHGNEVERTCEDRKLRDCQIANNIQYCYCYEDLCNGKTIHLTDDEDLTEEGSGTVITNSFDSSQKKSKTNQSNALKNYLCNIYLSILAILCN